MNLQYSEELWLFLEPRRPSHWLVSCVGYLHKAYSSIPQISYFHTLIRLFLSSDLLTLNKQDMYLEQKLIMLDIFYAMTKTFIAEKPQSLPSCVNFAILNTYNHVNLKCLWYLTMDSVISNFHGKYK
jgi:hypothetical protein